MTIHFDHVAAAVRSGILSTANWVANGYPAGCQKAAELFGRVEQNSPAYPLPADVPRRWQPQIAAPADHAERPGKMQNLVKMAFGAANVLCRAILLLLAAQVLAAAFQAAASWKLLALMGIIVLAPRMSRSDSQAHPVLQLLESVGRHSAQCFEQIARDVGAYFDGPAAQVYR